jgi:hypothetical protein
MIFSGGTGECLPKYSDPSSPCSSAVTDANRIDRGAATGIAAHTRQLQQDSASRRIIIRAVVDLVARLTRIDPQMVVVRRVQHGLFAEHGIRTLQHRQNISRDERFQLARYVGPQANRQLQRLEVLQLRPLKHLVQIQSHHSHNSFRHLQLDP